MPSDKAVFGSYETNPVTYDPDDLHTRKYKGPEKRRSDRRQEADRRGDVRFDLNASDRRQKDGRRHNDAAPKFW
ncbi:MAG: hypothetical protein DRQ97_10260 [Gammaproteobacteria bacterium]|nr:MAG: hypothetical protein DRQ97_10260 [Gammaproteobacteria bacterium]